MSDALEQMFDYVRSLNPDVALEINPLGINGQNRSWESGIDHARLLNFTQSFWSEEGNEPGLLADGRLITRVRSYKLARAYNNVLLTYVENNALALAEALAFNQTLGFVGSNPLTPVTREYIDFYRHHKQFYTGAEDLANVAVFRSYASLTYNNAAVQLCTVLVEQALIAASVPFHLMFDAGLNDPSKYSVLILPNTECLSDAQIVQLRQFVNGGGGLVVLGQAGLYDAWRRVRVAPGLENLVERQHLGRDYQEHVGSVAETAPFSSRREIGRGRVAYLSVLEFDGPVPAATPNFAMTSEFWRRPKNAPDLIELIRWASHETVPLSVEAADGVVVNCTSQLASRRVLLHLVNYNAAKTPSLHNLGVRLTLPLEASEPKLTLYAAGQSDRTLLEGQHHAGVVSFSVPHLETYALIAVEW